MPANENEEFEFRLRAEREKASQDTPAPDTTGMSPARAGLAAIQPAQQENIQSQLKPPGYGSYAAGIPEAALATGSGLIAAPMRGIGNIMTAAGARPDNIMHRAADAVTYSPRSDVGQSIMGSEPMRLMQGMNPAESMAAVPHAPASRGATALVDRAKQSAQQRMYSDMMGEGALKQRGLQQARELGLAVPPIETEQGGLKGLINEALGAVGKSKIEAAASKKNEPVINNLIRKDLGLPEGMATSPGELTGEIAKEYKAYDDVVNAAYQPRTAAPDVYGLQPSKETQGIYQTPKFREFLDKKIGSMVEAMTESNETFKELGPSVRLFREYRDKFERDPKLAMLAIRTLRKDAQTLYSASDLKPVQAHTAKSKLELANQLEQLFEDNLSQRGDAALVERFRNARTRIAKINDAMKALNPTTGSFSAGRYKQMYEREMAKTGKTKLTGAGRQVAEFAKQFPRAAQDMTAKGSPPALTPFDLMYGLGAAGAGHPGVAAAEMGLRGGITAPMMSRTYQNIMAGPKQYDIGAIMKALQDPRVRAAIDAAQSEAPYAAQQPKAQEP